MTITSSVSTSRKISVFYHLHQHGDWKAFLQEQLSLIADSGLADACDFIQVGVNGKQIPESYGKLRFIGNDPPWLEETPTLIALRDFCALNPDYKVLYIHTKGITQPTQSTLDWRKIMEYFCIEKWQDCLEQLNIHDAVGCLYMDNCYYGFFPHFSGNFWWANASYINRLDDSFLSGGIRQNREFWIGSGNGSLCSFHTTGLNHYAHQYPRHLYADQFSHSWSMRR
jgi:hypothetical protein